MRGTCGRTASAVIVAKKDIKHEGAVRVQSVAGRRREVMLVAWALNLGGIHFEVQFADIADFLSWHADILDFLNWRVFDWMHSESMHA